MQTAAETEALVASKLTTAADWKAKGEVRWELTCVGGAIESLLTIAVMHHDAADAGVGLSARQTRAASCSRYCALNTALLEAFKLGTRGAAVDNSEVFTHIAWLLDEHALGDAILAIVRDAEIGDSGRARSSGPSTIGRCPAWRRARPTSRRRRPS